MSVDQRSYYCPACQQQRLFTRQRMNHTPHILASVFLCGLWLPIWFLVAATYHARFHCTQCGGFVDTSKNLANPHLRQQEAEQRDSQQGFSIVQWYKSLSDNGRGLVIVSAIILAVMVIITPFTPNFSRTSKQQSVTETQSTRPTNSSNSTSNSSSNITNTSAKPAVYPAGLSPAENLEKGKKALIDGDQRAAWNHLSEIKKGAKEFVSAEQLLTAISERDKIQFELEQLDEREKNLNRIASGLAYKVEPSQLKKKLDNIEKSLRQIYARRQELNQKLNKMP